MSGENINLDFIYDVSGELIGLTGNREYFYTIDITGNIIGIIDGDFAVKYSYDAWGNVLNTVITSGYDVLSHTPFIYKDYFYDTAIEFFYLKSGYYNPTLRRFVNADDFSYLNTEDLALINLYQYCGNNPICNFDPDGTWDWKSFWKGVAAVEVAVVSVAAIAGITVATGGTAAPVIAGALIGAATSGATSATMQFFTTGKIDIGDLLVDMSVGGIMGAFGGSSIGRVGMTIASAGTEFLGSVASDWVAGKDIDFKSAAISAGFGAFLGFINGPGAQNKNTNFVQKKRKRISETEKNSNQEKCLLTNIRNLWIH